jgi:translocation and assembly module TamB
MRRRVLIFFVGVIALIIVAVATVPLWLGAAVKLGAQSRGLTFGSYERIGYSRFALKEVEYRRPGLRVTASRAEAETPLLWWWHRSQNRSAMVALDEWHVEVERVSRPTPAKPAPQRGWVPLRAQLQRIAAQLDRWLPLATTGAGRVRWPGGELTLAGAKWAHRELVVDDFVLRNLKLDAAVTFASDDRLLVNARTMDGSASLTVESRADVVAGDFSLWAQPSTVRARFGAGGWLPVEAALLASDWSLPGSRLKVGDVYAVVRGSGRIEWREARFLADVSALGEPLPGKSAPPLQLTLRGAGDTQAFTIESLNATLPGISALLSEPVTVERSGTIRESTARFTVDADLAKVPWFTATGVVNGDARLVSGFSATPVVEFSLDASNVKAHEVSLTSVTARGRLDWPRLAITDGAIVGGEGERLVIGGGWDFRGREIVNATVAGQIRRPSIARWLPKQPEFDAVELTARAEGPVSEVRHEGTARVSELKLDRLHPLALSAEWKGRAGVIDHFKIASAAGTSRVIAEGKLEPTGLTLTTLDFRRADIAHLQLAGPATVRWRPQLQVESLRLAGPEGSFSAALALGPTGRIEVAARNLSAQWFDELVVIPGPAWSVSLLGLTGRWDRGPMEFSLTGGASLEIGEGRSAAVNIAAQGDRDGIKIDALRATEAGVTVVNATGQLPITCAPGERTIIKIDPSGALRFDASVAPNAAFWQKLATVSGVDLKDPEASARLAGTWRQPEGTAVLRAARIAIDPKRVTRPLPAVESLDVEVSGDRGGISLSRFTLSIEGQAVRASGRLPVPEGQWDELVKEPLAAARKGADLRLEVPDAEVAVFTRFLPAVLAPKGRLQADVHFRNGGLDGFLRLRDAASRPLGPLGVLQEVSAEIVMTGRKFEFRGVTAKSGGQPVTLNGTVEVPENGPPRFDLALKGDNLPFVRQTGLLLRGNLDLKLQTPAEGQPRLSGNVRLRDSLFLSDVRSFLPKGGASATRRPPYFAIETQPVNAWQLAVDVAGEKFLRLRTPVFAGVASARFRLGGTLGEPRAIGEIVIDDGSVRMPFASFAVTQGSIRLTEADPYEPAVYLRGTGRRYGYDVTMEIDGTASQPNVMFTSSPPLDSEQVLLMVMTGAAPSNEITKSATQRVANIGFFLSQSLLGSLGSDAADADRLSFASGEKISRQGKETYDIEYRLSDRWMLTGEYNEFDEYNAGVKWRAFRGKSSAEKDDAKK